MNGKQNRAEAAILTLDKTDFTAKLSSETSKTLYNDKRVNLPGRYNNYKSICTQY